MSLHGIAGTGPGGRITGDDVTRGGVCGRHGRRARHGSPGYAERKGRRPRSRADDDAVHDRPPDVRVGDHDSDLHGLDRHRRVADRRAAAARRARRGRRRAVAQRLRRQGRGTTLGEFPRFNASYVDGTVECYSRVNVGDRGRHGRRAARAGRARRRPEVTGRARRGDANAGGRRAAANPEARGLPRRHVHGLESRHVRSAIVHRDHRPAAGRDPRRRRCAARALSRKVPTASASATR